CGPAWLHWPLVAHWQIRLCRQMAEGNELHGVLSVCFFLDGDFPMSNLIATTVLTCCGFACSICSACDCGHCNCGCPCSATSAAAVPATPAAPTTAQAATGQTYRTYSYHPAPAYAPSYSRPSSRAQTGFGSAGFKVRGY